jgi:hypothetical protein
MYSRLNDRVTYFMNKSHPLHNEMFVRPPKSSNGQLFKLPIATLSSRSNSIHVWLLLCLINATNAFIAATGTATSCCTN